MTFVNHGCKGTYNFGPTTSFTESNITEADLSDEDDSSEHGPNDFYNPFMERTLAFGDCTSSVALRDIETEEELLCNYMVLYSGFSELEAMQEVKRMCTGEKPGDVARYEQAYSA